MKNSYPSRFIPVIIAGLVVVFSGQAHGASVGDLKKVAGVGCFIYGDNDTPASAKKRALLIAKRNAIESYKLHVVSTSTIRNFVLEEDEAATMAEGMLYETKVLETTEKNREICVKIESYINQQEIDKLLAERKKKLSKAEGVILTGDWDVYEKYPAKSEFRRLADTVVWSYSIPEINDDTFAGINIYIDSISVKDKKVSISLESEAGNPINVIFFSFVPGYSKEDKDETYVPADCPVRLKPGKQEVLLDPSICATPSWWRHENSAPEEIGFNPEKLRYIDFNATVDDELGPVSDTVKIGVIRIH